MKCTYVIEEDNDKLCFADITVRLSKPNEHSLDEYQNLAKARWKKIQEKYMSLTSTAAG
jgi:hypothetical protein